MKVYYVINSETGYDETFYSLTAAKLAMKKNNATGYSASVRSNGDYVSHGEIRLHGNNKTFTANTKQVKSNY